MSKDPLKKKKTNLVNLDNDPAVQNELKAYEKYIQENKIRIAKRIILDAVLNLRLEQPIINCCKRINLSEFPNYRSDTIGQLLGKQGQHKQYFINLTGVDMELDKENANAVVLSKYNTVAVEKASSLIKKLLECGKWSTEKMKKLYEDVNKEWDDKCIEDGGKILNEFLKYEKFTDELAKYVGNLKHVYSFSQNILEHSNEVGQIAANIACQLQLDPLMAKRAGFFHDIGKAIANYEDHVDKGVKIATDAGLEPYIINAIESHHGRVKPDNPYSILVQAADKISAGREGARPRQEELIGKRKDMMQEEILTLDWIEKVHIKNAGNEIFVFIKLQDFSADKIPAMKAEIKNKLRELNTQYSYNFQIKFQLFYEESFFYADE